jgi:hypothetical protein
MHLMCFNKYLIALLLLIVIAGMGNIAYAVKPVPVITSASPLPNGVMTIPYSFTFQATSTQPPISNWLVQSGAPPPGLTLGNNDGVLSGTPTAAGTYTFGITCDDTQNPRTSKVTTFTLTISPPSCSFAGGINIGSIAFSNVDPSSTGNLYATAVTQQVAFTCNVSPMAYTINMNPSSGWMMQSGANTMAYTLGIAASGTYSGVAVNLLIPSGAGATSISQPDYQNAPSGAYANNAVINITVNWILGGAGSINATIPIGNVNGSVINMCTVSQSPGILTFNIDPSVSGTTNATISPDMQIKCTKNAGITIAASSACGGAAPTLANGYPPVCGANKIPYTFNFLSSITGQGFGGTGISLGLGGSAASANYATAPVGNYGDQQMLTITY